jgi:hypothetical protein
VKQTKYAFIGDVHSQARPLEDALNYCHANSLAPILLGDLFDSQTKTSDSPAVYSLVKKAQEQLGAVILRSNHQFLMEGLVEDRGLKLKKDVCRSLLEFRSEGICIQEVAEWLRTFPYVIAFRDSQGLEYRAAHAQIPNTIEVPAYESFWEYHNPTPSEIKLLLWGEDYSLPDRERFRWMRDKNRDWVAVAGHYHKVVRTAKTLVLDGGCGGSTRSWHDKRDPELLLYDVESKLLKSFNALLG